MHRTTRVPQSVCWSVMLGLVLQAGFLVGPAWAQPQVPNPPANAGTPGDKELPFPHLVPEPTANTVQLQLGDTKQIEMSKQQLITNVRVENPKIIQASPDPANPRLVLVTALSPGRTRVHLVDDKKVLEALDIYVPTGREGRMEQFMKAAFARFNDLVGKAVPTASVQAHLAGETVILTGTVPSPETIPIVMELARGIFRDPEGSEELSRLEAPGRQVTPTQPGGLPPAQPREITALTTRQRLVIVNALRVGGVQQVQLEVIVARVSRSEARRFGFSWMQNGTQHFASSSILASPFLATTLNPLIRPDGDVAGRGIAALRSGAANTSFGIVNDREGFLGFLQALRTEGLVKLMAEPKLVTLSGKPAYFLSGGEQAVPDVSGFGGTAGVRFVPFGTQVTFLPIVLGNGKIFLEVRPVINRLDAAAGVTLPGGGGLVPGRVTQEVRTAVEIEDGETFAIGGLIQNAIQGNISKVPVLGDIPFLGVAFSSKEYTEIEEELVILVTPRLVDPMACDQLPKFLPGQETRSPDDFELFLEGIMEAPRGCRKPCHGHKYVAAHRNGPTAGTYPCCNGNGTCGLGLGLDGGNGFGDLGGMGGSSILNGYGNGQPGLVAPPPRVMPEKGLKIQEPPVRMPPASGQNPGLHRPTTSLATPPNVIPVGGMANPTAPVTTGTVEFGPPPTLVPAAPPSLEPAAPPALGPANPGAPPASLPTSGDLPPPIPPATFGPAMQDGNP